MNPTEIRLPKGPSGRWLPTLRFMRDARETLEKWCQQYGDPILVNALNGPIVVTGRPDLISQIFSGDPMSYETFGKESLSSLLGEKSMLLLEGESHRQERKLIMPMFHGQRMRSYAETIKDCATRTFESKANGDVVAMHDLTTDISLEVIVKVLLGADDDSSVALVRHSQQILKYAWPIFFFSKKTQIRFLGMSPWDRFVAAQDRFRELANREIEKRENDLEGREDILSLFLGARYEDGSAMERDHLFDELGTFLFAGHETSAVTMAWAVYCLLTNREALDRLVEELDAAPDLEPTTLTKLPWLNAVIQETMRMKPIASDVLRVLKEPMTLGEYCIPAGYGLAPAIVLAHFNKEVYPEPDRFNPQRFIDRKYSSSEFIPFGGGARRCAGAAFALYEMAIVLGILFSRYELTLKETKPVTLKRRNIVLGPSTGVRVAIRRR